MIDYGHSNQQFLMEACPRKTETDHKVGGKDTNWTPPKYSLKELEVECVS